MPRLKRLLLHEAVESHRASGGVVATTTSSADGVAANGDDLLDMTAEQLFSESLHSRKLLQIRKQAAAICAAKPIRMSTLVDDGNRCGNEQAYVGLGMMISSVCVYSCVFDFGSHDSQSSAQRTTPLQNADMSSLEDCIELAVSVALEGQRVLFLVSNLPLISKLLAVALQRRLANTLPHANVSADISLSDASYASLQRVSLIQCRDVFQALCEMSEVQRMWKEQSDGYRLLVLAPLCELLGPFAAPSGLSSTGGNSPHQLSLRFLDETRTCLDQTDVLRACIFVCLCITRVHAGEGMRRMLQLALKRARASVPVQICVIQPLLSSSEWTGRQMVGASRNVDAHDYGEDDDDDK